MIKNLYLKILSFFKAFNVLIIPYLRQMIRFVALPYCFFSLVDWNECNKSRMGVVKDFLFIFFKLRYFPDNYSSCRFWEKPMNEWFYYYGSGYNPFQRGKLRKIVQRFEYEVIFEDKEVCQQVCQGVGVKTPIFCGVVDPDENWVQKLKEIFASNQRHVVIIKPVRGSAGKGIHLATKKDMGIFIKTNGRELPVDKFKLKERAIVQEIVQQVEEVDSFSSYSLNTIRVLTLYTISGDVVILGSLMRFGVNRSFVDNWSAGGVAVGIDIEKGMLKNNAFDKFGKKYEYHPSSKIKFNGFKIPMWDDIKTLAIKTQYSFPYFKLLGMDIAVSPNEPTLIEINAFPDIVFQEQTSGPLLKSKQILKELNNYDLLINRYQKNLLSSDDVNRHKSLRGF